MGKGKRGLIVYDNEATLTKKQKKWIDMYFKTLNLTQATKDAGYKGSDNVLGKIGSDNYIKFEKIIKKRLSKVEKKDIAKLEDVLSYWTKTFNDETISVSQRLRASELLGKSLGAFVEKIEVKQVETDWFKDG